MDEKNNRFPPCKVTDILCLRKSTFWIVRLDMDVRDGFMFDWCEWARVMVVILVLAVADACGLLPGRVSFHRRSTLPFHISHGDLLPPRIGLRALAGSWSPAGS